MADRKYIKIGTKVGNEVRRGEGYWDRTLCEPQ